MSGISITEEIKDKCNIVDVIGRVVQLKKAGANYKGVCPFHNEKTPSFVVSEEKQIFTCFGCGATGDVIEFVKRYYNLEFMDACQKLADEYGIEIKTSFGGGSEQKDRLYEINRLAARYFFKNITVKGNPGLTYMVNRGISVDTIKKFGIGYAPDSWDGLKNYMKEQKVDEKTLVKLGLLSESKGRYYDKFRNRVIFPIINSRGKVIGFGGRILGDGSPKYLNSPESEIFLKKNNLYGINLTRSEIASNDAAILVEGYMDVVSLYQAGVKNVSASLGTALTENQAKMLSRYTKNIILSYDADGAGRAAAMRGIDILHKEGLKAKVLHVTDGKDPDEFIKKKGRLAFMDLVDKALPYADYKIDNLMRAHNLNDTDGRIEFVKGAAEVLNTLSPAEKDLYAKRVAQVSGISEGAIRLEMNGEKPVFTQPKRSQDEGEVKADITVVEKDLIKISLLESSLFETVRNYGDVFESFEGNDIFSSMVSLFGETGEINIDKLKDSVDEKCVPVLNDIIENVYIGGKEKEMLDECISFIEISRLEKRYKQISSILDLTDDGDKIRQLMTEQMEIQKKIMELKRR